MPTIISLHTRHDANVCISVDQRIILVIELERIFNIRYFKCSDDIIEFKKQWRIVMELVMCLTKLSYFDTAITNWVFPSELKELKELIDAKQWLNCDHQFAHAALGYYDSNFINPLILSYDGGANDGSFNFYNINDGKLKLIEKKKINIGSSYRLLATLMPEVTNGRIQPNGGELALSGKLMGYSALGKVIKDWVKPLEDYFRFYEFPKQALYSLSNELKIDLEENCILDQDISRNIAATMQLSLENFIISEIEEKIKNNIHDGIVLSGGCALNVLVNNKVKNHFNLPVHVSCAPNDCGISIGSICALFPPQKKQYLAYLGLPMQENNSEYKKFGLPYSLKQISDLLVNENAIIGVARGNSEVGPRALGNRSIICYPNSIHKKDLINNEIKFREWYRPLAPMVPSDKVELFFDEKIDSPYMSFAPKFSKGIIGNFPAVEHFDKTARLQTVEKTNNIWLFNLLSEIESMTGYPILLNTSFNIKGKPLLNSVADAFDVLKSTKLTHVIIDNLIFDKSVANLAYKSCL